MESSIACNSCCIGIVTVVALTAKAISIKTAEIVIYCLVKLMAEALGDQLSACSCSQLQGITYENGSSDTDPAKRIAVGLTTGHLSRSCHYAWLTMMNPFQATALGRQIGRSALREAFRGEPDFEHLLYW